MDIIQQSFALNIRVLTFFGLYPERPSAFVKLRRYGCYFLLMIVVIFLTTVQIVKNGADITRINFDVICLAEAIAFSFKYLPFLTRGERIKKCINFFGHPKFAPKDAEEEKIIGECVSVCRRNSLVYFYAVLCMIILWIVSPLMEHQMPLQVWLPYDPDASVGVFYATFGYLYADMLYMCLLDQMDPLMGGLAYHATCQLKVLKYNLQNLEKYASFHDETSLIKFENVAEFLGGCVDRHNGILSFVTEYEKCFSFSIFSQIVGSMFTTSFCCIGLILTPATSVDFFKNVLIFVVATFQILFYCYYGTLLFEENEKFIEAVYMSAWYKFDVKIRKILIIMAERSKRPLLTSAGKVLDVTLQTFASVLKTSYSLIAVFKK